MMEENLPAREQALYIYEPLVMRITDYEAFHTI
jgi:hypothetical protein